MAPAYGGADGAELPNRPRGFAATQERFFLGSFWPPEVAQLRSDFGYEDLTCTGSAGTLVVFDGRGLHRATPLWG
jgi:hypothetical protein